MLKTKENRHINRLLGGQRQGRVHSGMSLEDALKKKSKYNNKEKMWERSHKEKTIRRTEDRKMVKNK